MVRALPRRLCSILAPESAASNTQVDLRIKAIAARARFEGWAQDPKAAEAAAHKAEVAAAAATAAATAAAGAEVAAAAAADGGPGAAAPAAAASAARGRPVEEPTFVPAVDFAAAMLFSEVVAPLAPGSAPVPASAISIPADKFTRQRWVVAPAVLAAATAALALEAGAAAPSTALHRQPSACLWTAAEQPDVTAVWEAWAPAIEAAAAAHAAGTSPGSCLVLPTVAAGFVVPPPAPKAPRVSKGGKAGGAAAPAASAAAKPKAAKSKGALFSPPPPVSAPSAAGGLSGSKRRAETSPPSAAAAAGGSSASPGAGAPASPPRSAGPSPPKRRALQLLPVVALPGASAAAPVSPAAMAMAVQPITLSPGSSAGGGEAAGDEGEGAARQA